MGGISYAPDINIPTLTLTGIRNDLWKYDPAINMWTWVKGDTALNHAGMYGTKGVADIANRPASREQASGWADTNGNLWLFGGNGNTISFSINYNDLWRYNIATNTWTWMKGENTYSQNGTYGTLGVASINNNPPSRAHATSWLDATGKLWLFGGRKGNYNPLEQLNDLWRYDPATNMWTWMKGANTVNQAGLYGTQGIPNTNNRPGARTTAISWRDASGDLWLYGGYGIDIGSYGLLGDLWRYNIATNNWTYMSGYIPVNQNGFYGIRGVATASNKPRNRENAACFYDASGNFYLFGGAAYYNLSNSNTSSNDMWRYNPATAQWTWLHGDTAVYLRSVYGTAAVSNNRNQPGLRRMATTFKDNNGNLWLFGGQGNDSISAGSLNDLWRYNPVTNQWTWMKGDKLTNITGVYGTKGTPAAGNKPGSRDGAIGWTDKTGNFWLFGGQGYSSSSSGFLNDLWRYNPATNQWTWMNGSNLESRAGIYGTQGTPAAANTPGGRRNAAAWTDTSGNLWLLGGYGYTNSTFSGADWCSDLWKYNITTNQWTWMKGVTYLNASGIYGTFRTEDAANLPGAREGAATWTDKNGYLWLQGGEGYGANYLGYLNDMWRYNPATNNWTWMNGGQNINEPEIIATRGVSHPANRPSGSFNVAFSDTAGFFYLATGSNGFDYSLNVSKIFSRIWRYDPGLNVWTWLKGDTTPSSAARFGIQGLPSALNDPGGRQQAAGWLDSLGNFWLYSAYYNDLWRLGTAAAVTGICAGGNTELRSFTEGATYQWQENTGSGFVNITNGGNYSGTTTLALQLTAIPAAWAGYQYRCVVDGLPGAIQGLSLTNTWRGGISDAWENPANWSCGAVPDANTTVVIPTGTLVIRSHVTIRSLRLSPGVHLSVDPAYTLTVLQ
ncbi:MAG: hypothetical protein JNM68_08140 [Dinghuibacter sp.]|nr:hypothetical protein [Dinghuibacter sp.]